MRSWIFFIAVATLFLACVQMEAQAAVECRFATQDTKVKQDGVNGAKEDDLFANTHFWTDNGGCNIRRGADVWCTMPSGAAVLHLRGKFPDRTRQDDDTDCLSDPGTLNRRP
jgi:beta-glucanase (GH16 family)